MRMHVLLRKIVVVRFFLRGVHTIYLKQGDVVYFQIGGGLPYSLLQSGDMVLAATRAQKMFPLYLCLAGEHVVRRVSRGLLTAVYAEVLLLFDYNELGGLCIYERNCVWVIHSA